MRDLLAFAHMYIAVHEYLHMCMHMYTHTHILNLKLNYRTLVKKDKHAISTKQTCRLMELIFRNKPMPISDKCETNKQTNKSYISFFIHSLFKEIVLGKSIINA